MRFARPIARRAPVRGLLLLATLALAAAGCDASVDAPTDSTGGSSGETVWELRSVNQEIQGGTVDSVNTAVVGIVIQNGRLGGGCTGSLIAPNLVLTAQHCVASSPELIDCRSATFGNTYAPSSFFVTTETNFTQDFRDYYQVEEVIPVPGPGRVCGEDMAVMILSENVPRSEAEPLVPRIDSLPETNDRYAAIGYGHTGSGAGAGTRRIIEGRRVLCVGTVCQSFGAPVESSEFIGNEGTCQGDSGGPPVDEDGRVMGALSRGGQGCSSSVYSGVYEWADWLREMGELAAERGDYPPPAWVVTGSSEVDLPDEDEDGIPDEYDNCVSDYNPTQNDVDFDGLGDDCDDVDDRDRGGTCNVCNTCQTNRDCARGGVCVDFGDGGVCTFECTGNEDCPETTSCFDVPTAANTTRSLCLNNNAGDAGVCAADWVCGDVRADLPADACLVCSVCLDDSDCGAGGLCRDFGDGPICTYDCSGGPGTCPGDSSCFDVGGESLCFNADAGQAGVCPAAYACGDGAGGGGTGGGGTGGGGTGGGIVDGGSGDAFAGTGSSGCAAAGSSAPTGALALALLGFVAVRRRRDAR